MQYASTQLHWNHYLLLWFSSLLWEEISICPLGRSYAVSIVLFFVTVTKCTVFESWNIFLTPSGSLPGHKTGRQKRSGVPKSFKASEFSFQCGVLKPQTSALLNPDHVYSPNASAQNIVSRCNSLRGEMQPLKGAPSLSQMFFKTSDWNIIWLDESYCHTISCFHYFPTSSLFLECYTCCC